MRWVRTEGEKSSILGQPVERYGAGPSSQAARHVYLPESRCRMTERKDVSASKAGRMLGVDNHTVAAWIRKGLLPGSWKADRWWHIPLAAVEALKTPREEEAP